MVSAPNIYSIEIFYIQKLNCAPTYKMYLSEAHAKKIDLTLSLIAPYYIIN